MQTIAGLTVREYHRRYYYKRRQKLIDILGDRCEWCGTSDNLQFDHVDPDLKEFDISENLTASNGRVRRELAKCQLLCRDCHMEKTRCEQLEIGFRHATMYAWMKRRCPCELCQVAKREWYDERNAKRRTVDGARGPYGRPSSHGELLHYRRGCRCDQCRAANAADARKRLRQDRA